MVISKKNNRGECLWLQLEWARMRKIFRVYCRIFRIEFEWSTQTIFEDLEGIYDAKVGDVALIEYREKDGKYIGIKDVMKQYGVK